MTPKRRKIDLIVLHCSFSRFGNATLIDEWHKERGWRGIGYHYVIQNGYPDEESFKLKRPHFNLDGEIEEGRPVDRIGAHVRDHNRNSLGICLIGKRSFTGLQFRSLHRLIDRISKEHPEARLVGHYELLTKNDPPKSCPDIDMGWLRNNT